MFDNYHTFTHNITIIYFSHSLSSAEHRQITYWCAWKGAQHCWVSIQLWWNFWVVWLPWQQKLTDRLPTVGENYPSRAAFQVAYSFAIYQSGHCAWVRRTPNAQNPQVVIGCSNGSCKASASASPQKGGNWIVEKVREEHNHVRSRDVWEWRPPKIRGQNMTGKKQVSALGKKRGWGSDASESVGSAATGAGSEDEDDTNSSGDERQGTQTITRRSIQRHTFFRATQNKKHMHSTRNTVPLLTHRQQALLNAKIQQQERERDLEPTELSPPHISSATGRHKSVNTPNPDVPPSHFTQRLGCTEESRNSIVNKVSTTTIVVPKPHLDNIQILSPDQPDQPILFQMQSPNTSPPIRSFTIQVLYDFLKRLSPFLARHAPALYLAGLDNFDTFNYLCSRSTKAELDEVLKAVVDPEGVVIIPLLHRYILVSKIMELRPWFCSNENIGAMFSQSSFTNTNRVWPGFCLKLLTKWRVMNQEVILLWVIEVRLQSWLLNGKPTVQRKAVQVDRWWEAELPFPS